MRDHGMQRPASDEDLSSVRTACRRTLNVRGWSCNHPAAVDKRGFVFSRLTSGARLELLRDRGRIDLFSQHIEAIGRKRNTEELAVGL